MTNIKVKNVGMNTKFREIVTNWDDWRMSGTRIKIKSLLCVKEKLGTLLLWHSNYFHVIRWSVSLKCDMAFCQHMNALMNESDAPKSMISYSLADVSLPHTHRTNCHSRF